MAYLVDTNVVVDFMRGSIGAADYIDSLADGWSISAITCLELLAGARTKRETIDLDLVLSGYRAIPPNEDITRVGLHEVVRSAHTFEVIQQTITRANELNERAGWTEPFVRVHFLAGQAFESGELEQLVDALNTSSQVQQFTLDEYQNKFDELKEALQRGGFDPSVVAFRENEDKEWDVREIVQRLACFLKERWKTTQPASMYRSKGKALDLYTNEVSHEEFKKLYDVAADVVTLPEFIQSEFSKDTGKGRKFGKLRGVKTLKKPQTPVGTKYTTDHQMDLAESLPIAAAFRELLELKGDRYYWKADYKEVFKVASEELYKTLLNKVRTTKAVNTLGADTEYWTQCANIVLRAKYEVLNK